MLSSTAGFAHVLTIDEVGLNKPLRDLALHLQTLFHSRRKQDMTAESVRGTLNPLRKLEQRGLLNRLVHPVVPPHVDYSITPAGNKYAEVVALLCEWAVQNKALLKQVAGRRTH
jgi:hypothetical protein